MGQWKQKYIHAIFQRYLVNVYYDVYENNFKHYLNQNQKVIWLDQNNNWVTNKKKFPHGCSIEMYISKTREKLLTLNKLNKEMISCIDFILNQNVLLDKINDIRIINEIKSKNAQIIVLKNQIYELRAQLLKINFIFLKREDVNIS